MIQVRDDLGRVVSLLAAPRRIVSLVPSVTETLFALGCGDAVIGVTRYCEEPAAAIAAIAKVGGTKNPDCAAIAAMAPDVVIVNAEENRREDFQRLESMGLPIFVTFPGSLRATVDLLRRLGELTGCGDRGRELAADLDTTIAEVASAASPRRRVFCPIWKNPWMTVAGGTYVDDVLSAAGGDNVFHDVSDPYPTVTLTEVASRDPEVVLLPSEPYRFSRRDLPDLTVLATTPALRTQHVYFVDGKALTWYGPRSAPGLRTVAELLRR